MKKALDVMFQNCAGVRSGRASAGMVENIRVDYYGTPTPLKQIANITIPEPKMLLIHPWDVQALKPIEKAIMDSDLGIAPVIDGKLVRLVVPSLTRERREELVVERLRFLRALGIQIEVRKLRLHIPCTRIDRERLDEGALRHAHVLRGDGLLRIPEERADLLQIGRGAAARLHSLRRRSLGELLR